VNFEITGGIHHSPGLYARALRELDVGAEVYALNRPAEMRALATVGRAAAAQYDQRTVARRRRLTLARTARGWEHDDA
jgi:hypothetical protein